MRAQEQAAANRPQFYSKNDKKDGEAAGQKRPNEEAKKPEIARKPFQLLSVGGTGRSWVRVRVG